MSQETKRKILEKALELYNERGVNAVTVRHIAAGLHMSHGNLCYHYPNTEALVSALYYQLVEEITLAFQKMQVQFLSISLLIERSEATFGLFHKYKFLMLDFVSIMRQFPSIQKHYKNLQTQRRQEVSAVFQLLQQQNLLKPEPIPQHFVQLVELMTLIGDFWMAEAEILFVGNDSLKIKHYAKLFTQLLLPYLTEKGMGQWKEYYKTEPDRK